MFFAINIFIYYIKILNYYKLYRLVKKNFVVKNNIM